MTKRVYKGILKRLRGGGDAARPGRSDPLRVVSYLVMAGIVVSILLPLLPIVLWAFTNRWFYPHLAPPEWSLRAWRYVLSPASRAGEAARAGGIIALAATALSLIIGVPAGRALGLHNFRGKRLVEFLILAPSIVPAMTSLMGIHVIFIKAGLSGTMAGVVVAHLIPITPYVTTVMASVFANYDPEYEEQARTLGAGPARTFLHVTLPTILPGIVVAGLFAFIISWGQYITTLLISGGRVLTVPLLLFTFAGARKHPFTAVLCLIFIAPSVLYLIVSSRYLTGESVAIGGVEA